MSNNNILLFGHGSCQNRGSQAIAQTTASMLKKIFPENKTLLATYDLQNDSEISIDSISEYIKSRYYAERFSLNWLKGVFYNRILHSPMRYQTMLQKDVIKRGKNCRLCLSVGGDNYCYDTPYSLYAIDKELRKAGVPLVLWGASVDPALIDEEMERDLMGFNRIFVRESLSFEGLSKIGLSDKLILAPDPAFTLLMNETPLPPGFLENETVGVNISPLVLDKTEENPLASVLALTDYIFKNTNFSVALIPHVTVPGNSDIPALDEIYRHYLGSKYESRLCYVSGACSAGELKYIISKLRYLITARTHASIAAYSAFIPTLVIGYSIKSSGIAQDLFGTDENFVYPSDRLNDSECLIKTFQFLIEYEYDIRNILYRRIPCMVKKASEAADYLKEIVNSE